MKWINFDQQKFAKQKLPRERMFVLVQLEMLLDSGEKDQSLPAPLCAVGYLKFGAGDKNSPYFVVHSARGPWRVTAWSDCLPDDFDRCWKGSV